MFHRRTWTAILGTEIASALKIGAECLFEISVSAYMDTQWHNAKDNNLSNNSSEELKSYIILFDLFFSRIPE
jgi:hypothetical protein